MTASPTNLERDALDEVEQRLAVQGYIFRRHPTADLPAFLKGFQPDAVASRGSQNLLIEVMGQNRSPAAETAKIERLRALLADQPGWRLEIVYSRPSAALPSTATLQAIGERLSEIRQLVPVDADAALVMGWSLLEALVRTMLPARAGRALTPGTTVELLASLGRVSADQANQLRAAGQARNLIVHGDLNRRVTAADVIALLDILDDLAHDLDMDDNAQATGVWRLEITSDDLALIERMRTLPPNLRGTTSAPQPILGAVASLSQIVADLNGLDLNVAGSLLAAWIWAAFTRTKTSKTPSEQPNGKVWVDLHVRRPDGAEIDIEVQADSQAGVEEIISAALKNAHPDS